MLFISRLYCDRLKPADIQEKMKRLSLKESPIYGELILVG